jgi:hypothetical protein
MPSKNNKSPGAPNDDNVKQKNSLARYEAFVHGSVMLSSSS